MNIEDSILLYRKMIHGFYICDFSKEALERCKRGIELIAKTLGLEGFSRIDAFVHVETGDV